MNLRKQYNFIEKLKVWFGRKTAIVLTMGKVGTLTICNSIRDYGWKHVHPHSLYFSWPGVHFLKVELSIFKKLFYLYKTFTKRLKVFFWSKTVREIIIITGVRDPFSRPISAFFEQIHYRGGIADNTSFNEVLKSFEDLSYKFSTLDWFDHEVKRFTGIDVYESSFDHEKGYSVIKDGKYSIFIYRVDKLNGLEKEIGEFLSIPNFKINSANFTSDSQYAELAKKMMTTYRYSKEDISLFLNSKYLNHFFSKSEINHLLEIWAEDP